MLVIMFYQSEWGKAIKQHSFTDRTALLLRTGDSG